MGQLQRSKGNGYETGGNIYAIFACVFMSFPTMSCTAVHNLCHLNECIRKKKLDIKTFNWQDTVKHDEATAAKVDA